MPESPPHQGPAIYLSRQPWGAAQRYHPLLSIPTRVAAPAPGTQHPHGTRVFGASGHNDSRTAMAALLIRRHHCTNREGGGACTSPLPKVARASLQRWIGARELPRVTNASSRRTYMSRWGLRATAPRVASTWYNLGTPTGEWRCEAYESAHQYVNSYGMANSQSSGAHPLVMAALPNSP